MTATSNADGYGSLHPADGWRPQQPGRDGLMAQQQQKQEETQGDDLDFMLDEFAPEGIEHLQGSNANQELSEDDDLDEQVAKEAEEAAEDEDESEDETTEEEAEEEAEDEDGGDEDDEEDEEDDEDDSSEADASHGKELPKALYKARERTRRQKERADRAEARADEALRIAQETQRLLTQAQRGGQSEPQQDHSGDYDTLLGNPRELIRQEAGQVARSVALQSTLRTSEAINRRQHEDFDEVIEYFQELERRDGGHLLTQQAAQDPDPWGFAYRYAKQARAIEEGDRETPEEMEARIRAEIESEAKAKARKAKGVKAAKNASKSGSKRRNAGSAPASRGSDSDDSSGSWTDDAFNDGRDW